MKKTYLVLAFLITGFLLVGDAYGEDEVYYCAEIDGNGFNYKKKSGLYERTGIKSKKFKLKLDEASKSIELVFADEGRDIYDCTSPLATIAKPELLSCVVRFYHFNFNTNNGRFVFSRGFGYMSDDTSPGHDSVYTSYGTCDKF